MRKVQLSTGRTGIVAARNTTKPLVFVLIDGDDADESHSAWFLADDVTFI